MHEYGAHIFHTSNKDIWEYINRFAEFNNYINQPVARYKNELYILPFNMNTFTKLWSDVFTPSDAKARIEEEKERLTFEYRLKRKIERSKKYGLLITGNTVTEVQPQVDETNNQ